MPKISGKRQAKLAARAVKNLITGRPVTVSFEVTFNCNADCEHCNWSRNLKIDEPSLPPETWGNLLTDIRPVVAQISGGEPLLRRDIYDIISEMRRRDPLAVFVLTTNAQILNEERYERLRACGIDEFSISLDYPDERHNEYRSLKNNFEKLSKLIPQLAAKGNGDIVMGCVVQSKNFRDLPRIAEVVREWGVKVNFSIYTHLRTGREYLTINPNGQLTELQSVVDRLIEMQANGYPIATSPYSMQKIVDFYRTRSQPNCKAGRRFFIVNPWGKLAPCGIIQGQFANQKELIEGFCKDNECDMCYTAIRANCEKSPYRMIADAMRVMRVKQTANGTLSSTNGVPVEREKEPVSVDAV
jgi:MoaA/NifB/PqqE/SkfB family radical SAM enzyme